MLPDPGYQGSNATPNLHKSSHGIRYFHTKILPYFHMLIVNHFRNKILSAQRKVLIMQILGRALKKVFFLFVRRKRHARVTLVFLSIKSHGVGRFFTYKVSVVISGQIGFAVKIASKC